jgi:peptide/nickel transport system substrate-binding protein
VNQAAIHRKMIGENKLGFFRASWIADYPDPENYLSLFYSHNFSPGGPNTTHFYNSEFDCLYELAAQTTDDSLRTNYYIQMDSLMMENAPVVVLYYDRVMRLYKNNITGLNSNAMNLLILKNVDIN